MQFKNSSNRNILSRFLPQIFFCSTRFFGDEVRAKRQTRNETKISSFSHFLFATFRRGKRTREKNAICNVLDLTRGLKSRTARIFWLFIINILIFIHSFCSFLLLLSLRFEFFCIRLNDSLFLLRWPFACRFSCWSSFTPQAKNEIELRCEERRRHKRTLRQTSAPRDHKWIFYNCIMKWWKRNRSDAIIEE